MSGQHMRRGADLTGLTRNADFSSKAQPPAAARATADTAAARPRVDSIDLLRGMVMILMALDHTRDFFGTSGVNPRDVTEPALFLTRWITHFCAALFVFLAGMSAWLYAARGRSTAELSWFLLTRGFWLIVLEFTVVRLGWTFSFDLDYFITQVIWVIGASMVVLAGLVYLPRWAVGVFGLALILGHNLLDVFQASDFGEHGWIWALLHELKMLEGENATLFAVYPLIPWAGVMAAGYALGPVMRRDPATRMRRLLMLGAFVTAGFVILRLTNLYGDPQPWASHDTWLAAALSFLNCEKYPPSLLYLAMTIGPGLILLALFENARGRLVDWITIYGRVPLLYYVAHLFLIHGLAVAFAAWMSGDTSWLFGPFPAEKPASYGMALPGVYAVWLCVVAALYLPCRWYAMQKQRSRDWWWSYL